MSKDTKFLYYNNDYIAYNYLQVSDNNNPTIIFCHGYMSDKEGSKALYLQKFCEGMGFNYIRFDYFGHGESSGDFEDGLISKWLDNLVLIIDELVQDEVILVGSSMGGWLALLAAKLKAERVVGLVTVACATDFTEELVWNNLTEEEKERLEHQGYIIDQKDYKFTKGFLGDGKCFLLFPDSICLNIPVVLLHGMADVIVPYQISLETAKILSSNDVEITLIKDGDHNLNRSSDHQLLSGAILRVINKFGNKS